jgi:CheY-like chemotaxis protein
MRDGAHARGLHILVVDDNRDAAISMSTLLELKGHLTATAFNGLDAVRAAGCLHFDVALLDLGMPVMDGFEAAAALRQLRSPPVLIACSAWNDAKTLRRTREVGFSVHLTKPVPLDLLDWALESARRTLARQLAGAGASPAQGSACAEVQQVAHPHKLG